MSFKIVRDLIYNRDALKMKIKTIQLILLFISLLLFQINTYGFFVESNIFYYSNTASTATELQDTDMAIDFTVGLDLTRTGSLVAGWSYLTVSDAGTVGSTVTTIASSGMGPKLKYYLNKKKNWNIGLTYILNSSTTYASTGATSEEWRGTIIKAELGYGMEFTETVYMGFNLNYYSTALTESIVGSAFTTISYSQGLIYPSFYVSYRP
jgi:hypothetical protein